MCPNHCVTATADTHLGGYHAQRWRHHCALSGKPRTTSVRAYRDGDKAYLVSINGEHALWLKNIARTPG